MKNKRLLANCLLLLTAIIWGSAFVAQRVGMEYIGPLTFGGTRFLLAAIVLFPVIKYLEYRKAKALADSGQHPAILTAEEKKKERKTLLTAGLACGTLLFCGSTFQQFGLVFTTAGKAAFITALYILLVPIVSLFLKKKPTAKVWVGVASGTLGLYFLCITESFTIAKGDFIVLIGAFFWTFHVLVIDHFLDRGVDAIKLAALQFTVCAFYGIIGMFLFEQPSWDAILTCAVPILYAGVLSGGVGFTLQIVGQKYTSPTIASLLMSMESVFGALSGFLLLQERMSARELLGSVLMFAAIVISQLPGRMGDNSKGDNL